MPGPGQDAAEIVVAIGGHIYVAPVGSTPPTDATTAPAAAFLDIGFTDDSGVKFSASRTIVDINAWQSLDPLRKLVTARDISLVFNLLQWDYETVKLAFGGGTVTGASPNYKFVPPDPSTVDYRAMIIDGLDGGRAYRWWIPKGVAVDAVAFDLVKSAAAVLPIGFHVLGQAGVDAFQLFVSDAAFSAT